MLNQAYEIKEKAAALYQEAVVQGCHPEADGPALWKPAADLNGLEQGRIASINLRAEALALMFRIAGADRVRTKGYGGLY